MSLDLESRAYNNVRFQITVSSIGLLRYMCVFAALYRLFSIPSLLLRSFFISIIFRFIFLYVLRAFLTRRLGGPVTSSNDVVNRCR